MKPRLNSGPQAAPTPSSPKARLSRRALLRGAAGLAIGLPFLDAMLPFGKTARADDKKPPRRVVFIHTPDGFLMERWTCPITGTEASLTDPKFPISDTLKEFQSILGDCLFLEGVENSSARDARSPAQGHPGGTTSMFTGAWAGPGNQYAGGPDKTAGPPQYVSIDHAISNGLGQVTRFPALYAGVRVLDNTIARRPFYGEAQAILAPEQDPHKVFSTVFGELDPAKLAELKEQGTERQFVLDGIKGDYASLRCKLGSSDRQRLDGHLSQIEQLAGRLKLIGGGMSCTVPPAVPASLDPGDFDSAPILTTTMLDMVAMAFACDLTRVVGFQLHASDADGGGVYSWLDHPTDFHDISHREGDDPEGKIQKADAWRAQQIVHLVETLKSLKEADGSTVFDNTTILWSSEIGNGASHDYHLPAWNIIGGAQGYFRTGRYLKYKGDQTTRHNLLLLHYLKMFGLDISQGFGHPDYAKGTPLPNLT